MSDEIVRCPYCVEGGEFRPMVERPAQGFLCSVCGHMSMPGEPSAKCACNKCREANDVALRQRGAEEARRRMISDLQPRAGARKNPSVHEIPRSVHSKTG